MCELPLADFSDTTGCRRYYQEYGFISGSPGPLSPYDGVEISKISEGLFILVASGVYLIIALPKLLRLRLETETKYH